MQEHITALANSALRTDIEDAIGSALGDIATQVGVRVDDGTVTLTGQVADYVTHMATLHAVVAVDGVSGVADELEVGGRPVPVPQDPIANDTLTAAAAQRALQSCDGIPVDAVTAEVRDNILTLVGAVSTAEERLAAERAVIYLPGLIQIWNRIHIVPKHTVSAPPSAV